MNPGRFTLLAIAFAAVASLTACAASSSGHSIHSASARDAGAVARVLLLSVDGLHEEDVARCMAASTCPHIAALAATGVQYTNAATPGLSDSFPGLAALLTGGTPKSTGLFYDVSYDRTLYAPGDAHCTGATGWNMVLDETVGIDAFNGGSAVHLDGGGDFNPQAIPHTLENGRCVPVHPHDYLQTNTVFEIVKAGLPGARTALADKHAWAYDWVNGPSGHGVDDLARTEISAIDPATGHNYEDAYAHTEAFDDLHLRIVLNQIDGKTSMGADAAAPTLFGTNFQTLSVAQKAVHANGGGYVDASFTPGTQVAAALHYVDNALGRIVAELQEKHLAATTLVVLTAKHGQSASDHATLVKHGDTLTALLKAHGVLGESADHVGAGLVQTDDVGLIWLKDQSRTPEVVALLKANAGCAAEGICADGPQARILSSAALVEKFGDPARGRTPDIVVLPNPGVLYSASKKKDADHGGDAPDDRHVALIVSLPSWAGRVEAAPVVTTQVAPTILAALKLDPTLLHAVKAERTPTLPDITFPRPTLPMHKPLSFIVRAALFAAPFASLAPAQAADVFHAGDLVLSVYGNGANTGHYDHNRAAPIVLREITTTGAFVGQIALPQSSFKNAAGETNFPISGEYGSSSEGTLQLSADGHLLLIMGYGIPAGVFNDATVDKKNAYGTQALAQTGSLKNGTVIAVPRVVAAINAQGEVDTRTALFDFADTNNPRSVATVDGSVFYVAGQGHKRDATQGVQYVRAGASSGTVLFHGTDVRIATIADGKLVVSTDTKQGGTPEAPGTANIAVYGDGLPTAPVTPTILPGLSNQVTLAEGCGNGVNTTGLANLSPQNFFFANATTLYVADGGQPKRHGLGDGGLQKWSLVGGSWQLDYTLSKGLDLQPNTAHVGNSGLIGLTGRVIDGRVELFATTSSLDETGQTFVVGITDSLSANRLPADEAFQVLAASAPDTVIRGIAFAPLPR